MPTKKSYPTVTDQFCGAGGSSQGARAVGMEVVMALNHWELAIETHNTNFPDTHHDCTDISASDPRRYPSTDILVTSPECTNHTFAQGKKKNQGLPIFGEGPKPEEERSRATMWDVVRFAEYHQYNIIVVENVVEARSWRPWPGWIMAMDNLGYDYQICYLNSMFFWPTPQSRNRMYVVFHKKGNRAPKLDFKPPAFCHKCGNDVDSVQSFKRKRKAKDKKWGIYGRQGNYYYRCPVCAEVVTPYYFCAANIIDWSITAPKLRDRKRPLKERTMKRIRIGLERYGNQGLVIPIDRTHGHNRRGVPETAVIPTQTGNHNHGLAIPPHYLMQYYSRENASSGSSDAIPTVTGDPRHALVSAPMIVETSYGNNNTRQATDPLPTQTTRQSLTVSSPPPYFVQMYGTGTTRPLNEPVSTMTAGGINQALIQPNSTMSETAKYDSNNVLVPRPYLISYYNHGTPTFPDSPIPTVTTKDRQGLVTNGHISDTPDVMDCTFRMLQPHEIRLAMAFPDTYTILGTKRQKIKLLGNAVTPPVMEAILKRCLESLEGVQ